MKYLGAWIRLWMMRMLILFIFLPFIFALTLSEIILPLNPKLAYEIYGFIFSIISTISNIFNIYFHIPYIPSQQPSILNLLSLITKIGFFCLCLYIPTMWLGWNYLVIYKFINGKSVEWYKVLPHPRFTKEYKECILDFSGWYSKFEMICFLSLLIILIPPAHFVALVPAHSYKQWIQEFISSIHFEDPVLFLTSTILTVSPFVISFIFMVSIVRFVRAILPLFKTPPQYVFPYESYFNELLSKLCDKLSNSIGKKIKTKIGEHRFDVLVVSALIIILLFIFLFF